jgi:4-amino-4-deoxy-L-arabinose transferase-like glycosyltransferase
MKPFRIATFAACAAATVPRLAHRGMFVDGLTYASIARNLAAGRGSFWSPSYTATIYPQFHEHPPLGFWLQSLWFRALGDHLFVERVYALTAAVATAWLIARIWRRVNDSPDIREYDWLPILLWMAVPVVSWAIVGNLLETTVSIFTTAAVAAIIEAERGGGTTSSIGWGIFSGACVVAAVLTKGPVGLFPLAGPVIFFLISKTRRVWACLAGQWATVIVCFVVLSSVAVARSSLTQYVNNQVLPAVSGQREVSASSLTIVKELLQNVVLPILVVGGLMVGAARRFVAPLPRQVATAASFLVLGLASTLPIIASAKQAGHYLVPAVPLYALGAAGILVPTAASVAERIVSRHRGSAVAAMVTAALLLVTIGAAWVPALGRDRARLADLDAIEPSVPRGATIGICPESNGDWGLHAWFERRFLVSLDAATAAQPEWFLQTGASPPCSPVSCAPATDPSRQLVLLKCRRP